MNFKKMAGTAAIATGLGAAVLGLGAGTAQADDHGFPWNPGGPPGQVKKECIWGFGPCGTPPGHWPNGPQGPPPWFPWQR
jgi:hypothetical protein